MRINARKIVVNMEEADFAILWNIANMNGHRNATQYVKSMITDIIDKHRDDAVARLKGMKISTLTGAPVLKSSTNTDMEDFMKP